MKKYLFLSLVAALFLTACSDKETDPVLTLGNAPAIGSPANGTSIVLTEATAAESFPTFTWSAAEYGYDAAVTYSVEMDVAGNNFADPLVVGTVNKTELTVNNEKINNLMLGLGLEGEVEHDMQFRISAKISPEVAVVYSNPITLKITPYTVVIVYPQLQVPGSYQGWAPDNNSTVIFSVRSDEKYEGYIFINADNSEFKYTKGPSWANNWGDNDADGTLDKDGANIKAPLAGVYKLNADLNALTHSFTRTDWGLIGSATPNGWDSDQNMTYDPATNKWTITLDLVAGEIKFRANDDWGINLGDDGANKSLEYGGANIAVPDPGNYTIELLLGAAVYKYKITKN